MKRKSTPKIHFTLRPKFNLLLITIEIIAVLALGLGAEPRAIIPIIVGVLGGCIIGVLQQRAIKASIDSFIDARTATEVRAALHSTRDGELATKIQWGTVVVLIVVGITLNAIEGLSLLHSLFVGYLTLMLLRDMFTFPATL